MEQVYLCRACCEKEKVDNPFSVENNIGRKCCHKCGDNDIDLYMVEYDDELGFYQR